MPKAIDLTNKRFGRLLVLRRAGSTPGREAQWMVRCDCGATKVLPGTRMRRGRATSCGCLHPDHGQEKSPTYRSWATMIQRCTNAKLHNFPQYGGRGISVCPRWLANFANFLADMGPRPSGTTLDRFPNNDGNYEPTNCRWATKAQQARNTSRNHILVVNGTPMILADAAKAWGLSPAVIYYRLKRNIALPADTPSPTP